MYLDHEATKVFAKVVETGVFLDKSVLKNYYFKVNLTSRTLFLSLL